MGRLPVLMYHRIVSDRCPVPGNDREEGRYAVSLSEFERHVREIVDSGRRAVSVREMYERLRDRGRVPANWVGMTFDDGNLSDYEHARPLLLERGFTGTFFVSVERLGIPGGLERDMVTAMAREGLDIGSHGMTHRFLTGLSADEEAEEMGRSKTLLEEVCGTEVSFYAPPGGRIGRRGVDTLKRLSYRAVCTSVFGFNRTSGDRYEYSRIAITASTSPAVFGKIIGGSVIGLLPLYARDRGLRWARRILGEQAYGRLRSAGLGS